MPHPEFQSVFLACWPSPGYEASDVVQFDQGHFHCRCHSLHLCLAVAAGSSLFPPRAGKGGPSFNIRVLQTRLSSCLYLVYEGVLGQVLCLLIEAEVQFRRGQDVRQGSEAMEQHGRELDDQDEGEEEHKHQTDGLQLQIFLTDVHLEVD